MVLVALGCGSSSSESEAGPTAADDARRYAALVSDPDPDPAVSLPACAELGDSALRGDCALAIALRARARGTAPLESLCPQVPQGAWQDECFFMLAEDEQRQKRPKRAAAACMKSGAFKHDCGQHLWQGELRKLVRGTRGRLLANRVESAQRVYARWEPLLPETDISWRFWQRFFERSLEAEPGISLDFCAPLDPQMNLRCRYAAGHLYLRRLWDHLHHSDDRARFCAQDQPTVASTEALFPRAAARPDPLLEAVVGEQFESVCTHGTPAPAEDGVVSKVALLEALAALEAAPPPQGASGEPDPTGN